MKIIDHLRATGNDSPDHGIRGFHLYNRSADKHEDPAIVRLITKYLKNTGSKYYTCHCTGLESYKILKEIMGEKIGYLATGSQLII